MNFGSDRQKPKAWKDIWGCGQGIGAVTHVPPAGELVARLAREYEAAQAELQAKLGAGAKGAKAVQREREFA
jgi:nitronate monooxygenase